MSNYYSISGRVELYDFEKFRDWLFEELQELTGRMVFVA